MCGKRGLLRTILLDLDLSLGMAGYGRGLITGLPPNLVSPFDMRREWKAGW